MSANGVNFVEVLIPVFVALVTILGTVLVARINTVQKVANAVNEQVTNHHASSESPANLRVQMDMIDRKVTVMERGHLQFREDILLLLKELRAVQAQNNEMMNHLIEADQQLGARIDNLFTLLAKQKGA